MRKLIYLIATTIDGYIAKTDGSVDGFLMEGDHVSDMKLSDYDAVLMGRGTYEFGFKYGLKKGEPAYPNMKHYIFSKSMQFESNDGVVLINENEIETIKNIKNAPGKNIWLCGGGALASSLLTHRLIDEIHLKVNPLIFGNGIGLFQHFKGSLTCNLLSSKTYSNGVTQLKYQVIYT